MKWGITLACGMIVKFGAEAESNSVAYTHTANHGEWTEKIVTATWITTPRPTSGLIVMLLTSQV